MEMILNQIDKIYDIEKLIDLKQQIKNQIIDYHLNKKTQAKLYKQVQLINDAIEQITQYR